MAPSEAFWKIHEGLPRQAPGSDDTTRRLLRLAGSPTGSAIDIGCDQGHATLLLAQSGMTVAAIDTHEPFLEELRSNADGVGMSSNITTRNISMDKLDYPNESFDVIWSEGSAYILGWQKAISEWKRPLKPGGALVVTELCWLTDSPSDEARQFWAEGYPTMLTVHDATEIAVRCGYSVAATYTLPASDWFTYYDPERRKLAQLSEIEDQAMKQAIASVHREIEMYEQHGEEYSYVGFILKKPTN